MERKFITTLEKISEMAETESWHDVMEQFILPKVLKKSGKPRNYQISDEFMTVVAEYAQLIVPEDRKTADILVELAMQRLSCGAVNHTYLGTAMNLPLKYAYYAATADNPALMTEACWDFLQRGFAFGLSAESEKVRDHAKAILFGLIFNLNADTGKPLNGYNLGMLCTRSSEVKDWAWKTALKYLPFEEFWPRLVYDGWTKYKNFFANNWDRIEMKEFHKVLVSKFPPQMVWKDLARDGWERHIGFFHNYWYLMDKQKFFAAIGVKGMLDKLKITMQIKHYQG